MLVSFVLPREKVSRVTEPNLTWLWDIAGWSRQLMPSWALLFRRDRSLS